MECKHEHIKTWWYESEGDTTAPADMWSCSACGLKFVPITEVFKLQKEIDDLYGRGEKVIWKNLT